MTNKKFNAILAKNEIARMIREAELTGEMIGEIKLSSHQLIEHLKDIEDYLGQGNQPCIIDILEDEDHAL